MSDPSPSWDLRPFELLTDGWRMVQPHYLQVAGALLATGALLGIFSRLPWVGAPGMFLAFCTGNSGVTWYLLRVCRGEAVSWATFFTPMQLRPGAVIGLHAMCGAIILAGLVCLLLPGIYLAIAFELSLALLLAQDLTPWQALRRSHHTVHQQLGDFVMLSLTLLVINALGAMLFGLPLVWTLPATCGAATLVVAQVLGWRLRVA